MSMSIGGATVTVVKAKVGGMECCAYADELQAVLAMINNGALGKREGFSWYGSPEHKAALGEVERQLAETRANISKQEAADESEPEADDGHCACGAVPGIEELDSRVCASCGGIVE